MNAERYSPAVMLLFKDKGILEGVAWGLGYREKGDELVARNGRSRSLNGGGPKHRQPPGVPLEPQLFIAPDQGGGVLLTEGETDSLSAASALGTMPPIGDLDPGILCIPGTGCPVDRVVEAVVDLGSKVAYIATDNDKAGNKYAQKLAYELTAADVEPLRVQFGAGEDMADTLVAVDPEARSRRLADLLSGAKAIEEVPEDDFTPEDNRATAQPPVDRMAEWEICGDLASQPRILETFAGQLARAGLVGEDKLAQIIFLATVSRLLPRPVNIAVKGPSAGGKSFTVETVLEHFPESAYYSLSAMSERALAYSEEPLVNRMLVIYEAAGMEGEFASYLLRSLLSEGCVRYETVEKTKEGIKARLIERPGPTGLIVTTTKTKLHPENETRLISLVVKDTPDQTRAVMRAIADEDAPDLDVEPWHALQRWLEPRRVAVPYAKELAELIPAVAVRLRRDFGSMLGLIRAHALLHQASRIEDEQGRIVATLEDYGVVRDLVADLVASGVGAGVSPETRETVDAVDRLAGEDGVTQKALVDDLGLDKSAISRRVRVATGDGYLRNLEEKRGRPARLVLGEPLPEDLGILPAPEKLSGCAVARLIEGDNQADVADLVAGAEETAEKLGVAV